MENHTRLRLLEQTKAAKALVASIPEEYFVNPTTTFIDPAMGGGQYLAEIVKRCEKYHAREQIMPRVYGVESRAMFITRAKRYNNLEGANFTLDLNSLIHMKFDVVIGNPPYQDSSNAAKNVKLWPKFIKRSIELLKPNGFISLITPDSWAKFDSLQSRRQRNSIINEIDLQAVVSSDESFSVGVSIARWFGVKRKYSNSTSAYGVEHDFSQGPHLSDSDLIAKSIYDKVKSFKSLKFVASNGHIKSDDCKESSGNVIRFSGSKVRYTSQKVEGAGVAKFVAPFSCSPYSRFFTTDAVGMLNLWIPCDESKASSLSKIWDLKVVRFFLDTYQKTAGFTPAVKNSLVPDLTGMSDAQAYAALNLTKEEVEVIEAHCK